MTGSDSRAVLDQSPRSQWETRDLPISSSTAPSPDGQELMQHVLEHAPIVVWQVDRSGVFTVSQGRGLETLNLSPGEVVGQSVFDLYQDQPQVIASMRQVLEGHEQQILIEVSGAYFDSWLRPMRDAEGRICGAMGVASDVTSRIRAQDSERSSTERFLKAFHVSPAGIMLTDLATGRILDVNSALCRLGSYERDQLVGHTTLELNFWPDRETRQTTLRNAIENHGQARFNFSLPTLGGRTRRVKIVVEVIELDGRPCALSIIRDARVEQRMRRALRRSRRRYLTLARLAPVGIFRARSDGNLCYANDHFCGLFQRDQRSLLGHGWWNFVAPVDRADLQTAWEEALKTNQSLSCEFRGSRGSEEVWLQLQVEPASVGRGFVGSLTDITRRKRAELELQNVNQQLEEKVQLRTEMLVRANKILEEQIFARHRAHEELEKLDGRWRSLVDEAPDVILLVDREGRINYINHTGLRPGLSREQVIGRSVYEFALDSYRDEIYDVLQRVFEFGKPVTHEVQGPGDDGDIRWFQSHLAPIQYTGKVIGATAIVRDVTAQRRANEQLRITHDQLAHAGRVSMVGEMMAGFAHELGQPLFAIASYIDGCLIRLQREPNIAEDVLQVMGDAVQQAHRAIEVVRRLREFLQRHEIQRSPTDLNQIVTDAVELAETGLRQFQVRCQLQLSPDLPPIEADRIQLMQVLVNLLLNAAEAMASAGVAEGVVTVRTTISDKETLLCEVSDIGPGLPPGQFDEIFNAFVTTKPSGLGLGLSISRSIVEAHGGRIRATDKHHESGACFTIHLPCR